MLMFSLALFNVSLELLFAFSVLLLLYVLGKISLRPAHSRHLRTINRTTRSSLPARHVGIWVIAISRPADPESTCCHLGRSAVTQQSATTAGGRDELPHDPDTRHEETKRPHASRVGYS
jgi:hypothetical protein